MVEKTSRSENPQQKYSRLIFHGRNFSWLISHGKKFSRLMFIFLSKNFHGWISCEKYCKFFTVDKNPPWIFFSQTSFYRESRWFYPKKKTLFPTRFVFAILQFLEAVRRLWRYLWTSTKSNASFEMNFNVWNQLLKILEFAKKSSHTKFSNPHAAFQFDEKNSSFNVKYLRVWFLVINFRCSNVESNKFQWLLCWIDYQW